jgi:hypothetical protein
MFRVDPGWIVAPENDGRHALLTAGLHTVDVGSHVPLCT